MDAEMQERVRSKLRLVKRELTGDNNITGDKSDIWGDASGIRGDVLGIKGNVSRIRGDVSEIIKILQSFS